MDTKKFNELFIQVTNHMTESIGFVNTYMKDNKGQGYQKASASNYLQILSGEQLWTGFPSSQRDVINGFALTQECKPYELLLREANMVKLQAEQFLIRYLYGKDKKPQYTVTAENYACIVQSVYEWNKLTSEERKAIHQLLVYHQGESYPLLYERAMHVKKEVDAFISAYVTDIDKKRYTEVNDSNYLLILSGQKSFEEKSRLIQDAIDRSLQQPTYMQLLNGATMLLDSTMKFIHTFLTDANGNLLVIVDESNYHQVLQGKVIWKRMTKSQKVMIDQLLREQDRKIYEDLLDDARVIQYELSKAQTTS